MRVQATSALPFTDFPVEPIVIVLAVVQVAADVALVAVVALPETLIGQVPVGVPLRVMLPDDVTVPLRVNPP